MVNSSTSANPELYPSVETPIVASSRRFIASWRKPDASNLHRRVGYMHRSRVLFAASFPLSTDLPSLASDVSFSDSIEHLLESPGDYSESRDHFG